MSPSGGVSDAPIETAPGSASRDNPRAAFAPNLRNISISNNVGGVKHEFKHTTACTQRSAISLWWMVCAFQPGLAFNRSSQELSPTQPSLRSLTAIMITCSNSLEEGAGYPIITSVITAHHRDVRALPRANRASAIGRSPNLAATSNESFIMLSFCPRRTKAL